MVDHRVSRILVAIAERIFTAVPSCFSMVRTTSDKQISRIFKDFSRTNYSFQGLSFIENKSAVFNLLLNTLLAKTI